MYPHELSGGMKQRVCIAIAIACSPKVIIADEPTSALDVVVQRQVMETLGSVQQRLGAAVILVGHDMGLMAQFVDRLGVMYAGTAGRGRRRSRDIFTEPLHPVHPAADRQSAVASTRRASCAAFPALPPSLLNPPPGCAFHPRCPLRVRRAAPSDVPVLREVAARTAGSPAICTT